MYEKDYVVSFKNNEDSVGIGITLADAFQPPLRHEIDGSFQ